MCALPFTELECDSPWGDLMTMTLVPRLSALNLSDNPISIGRGESADVTGLKALLKALSNLHDTTLISELELVVDNSLRLQVGPELESARRSFEIRQGVLTLSRYDEPTGFFDSELRAPQPVLEFF